MRTRSLHAYIACLFNVMLIDCVFDDVKILYEVYWSETHHLLWAYVVRGRGAHTCYVSGVEPETFVVYYKYSYHNIFL